MPELLQCQSIFFSIFCNINNRMQIRGFLNVMHYINGRFTYFLLRNCYKLDTLHPVKKLEIVKYLDHFKSNRLALFLVNF